MRGGVTVGAIPENRMNKLKDILMICGVIVAAVGLMLSPLPYIIAGIKYGAMPVLGLAATTNECKTLSLVAISSGLLLAALSLFIKRKSDI